MIFRNGVWNLSWITHDRFSLPWCCLVAKSSINQVKENKKHNSKSFQTDVNSSTHVNDLIQGGCRETRSTQQVVLPN